MKPISFGFKFGPNIGWAGSGSTAAHSDKAHVGFAVGGFVDHYLTPHIAVTSGLNLNWMRMDYTFEDYRTATDFIEEAKVPVKRRFKGAYVELPIKVKAKVEVMDSWQAYVEAGIGFSYNFSDKGKDTFNDPFGRSYEDLSYKDYSHQYRAIQTALNFGLGAIYEVNSKFSLFAQITINNALSNTFNKATELQTGSVVRTNFVGLEVGICN